MTHAEVAELWRCTESFVRREARLGRIEVTVLGNRHRFTQEALDDYVERHTRPAEVG